MPRARPSKDFPRPGEDVAGRRPKGERAVERSETERVLPGSTLSVTALPCHLSRKGEALAKAESLCFTGQLVLSLTNKDETYRFCQGRPLRGSWHSRQAVTEGVLPISPLSRQSTERVSPKTTLHTKMTRADTRAIQIFSAGTADLTSAGHSPVSGCCSSQIHSRILSGRFVTMASGPKGSSERSTLRVSTVQNATLTPSA